MRNELDLQKEFKLFEENENHFEFFRELALEYLNIDIEYVKDVMSDLLDICNEKNYNNSKHWCILYLGWVENLKGNLIEAIKLHTTAIEYFEKNSIKLGYGAAYNALLVDYLQSGYSNLTIESSMKCIKFCETLNNFDLLIAIVINTIYIFMEHGYYDESKVLLDRIKIYKNNYRPDYRIDINIIEATYCLKENDLAEAERYCNNALKIIEKESFSSWKNQIYSLLAQKLYKEDKYEEGRDKFIEAIELSKQKKDKFIEAKILVEMAKYEYAIKEYASSENAIKNALDLMKDNEYLSLKEKCYYYLSKIYESYGDYEKAYNCLKEYLKYKRIITDDNNLYLKDVRYNNIFSAVEEYKELYNKIEKISNLCKNITSNLDIENCTDEIYKAVSELVDADVFGIATYNSFHKTLKYMMLFIENKKHENISYSTIKNDNLAMYCLKEKTQILINDIDKEYSKYKYKINIFKYSKEKEYKSIIYIPLMIQKKVIGIMTVQSKKTNAYSINDLNELKILASYVAIAIKNLQLFNKVKYFAEHDILTETLNRNKILKVGNDIYNKNKDNLCLAMIDVDKFKSINDTYGHVVGDLVLKNICGIISESIGSYNYIGRYGGEEFLIIFKNTNENSAYRICEEFRNKIMNFENVIESNKIIHVSITVGLYEFDKDTSFHEGIKKADRALYIGKENGRNKSIVYSKL